MTLRRRLLLVYLIIVVLSCATVGIAVRELLHARTVVDDLKRYQDITLNVQKLKTAFERDALLQLTGVSATQPITLEPEEADFTEMLKRMRQSYASFDLVRHAFSKLLEEYEIWREQVRAKNPLRHEQISNVRRPLETLTQLLENQLRDLRQSAQEQDERTVLLLIAVMALTIVHLAIVGAILRRWLLRPMERLGRQVAALGRGEPPPEPLVASPAELADLASALERARLSLEELRRRLIESERMTTVGQLAAQLAHNLRNPLASIRAAAQVAAKQGHVDEYAARRLEDIIAAADRLARWVGGLMEFVRPRSTRLEPHDVVPLLYQIREAVSAELSAKELSFEIVAPPDGIVVPHEPPSLEQALIAAVINAIEASPVGGRILAQAEWVGPEACGKACCRVSIVDQGSGLPDGPPDQIFELNFSTKQSGMGLGLTLARQAVQRQGGSVCARPNATGGTIIEFHLPAAPTAPAEERHGKNPRC